MSALRRLLLLLFVLAWTGQAWAANPADLPPDQLVGAVMKDVLSDIQQHRGILHDLRQLDALVAAEILPHFDFPRMTHLTIGNRYWDQATPQQQREFTDAYRTFLAHSFANVIAEYTDQTITVAALPPSSNSQETTVRTSILAPADQLTELDYRMEKTAAGWMIYDVEVDNIGLTRIYHLNFVWVLHRAGIPGLLHSLQQKNQEVAATRPAG